MAQSKKVNINDYANRWESPFMSDVKLPEQKKKAVKPTPAKKPDKKK